MDRTNEKNTLMCKTCLKITPVYKEAGLKDSESGVKVSRNVLRLFTLSNLMNKLQGDASDLTGGSQLLKFHSRLCNGSTKGSIIG